MSTSNSDLVYISGTRIPSDKANSYQSFVMCEALSRCSCNIEFWYPNMRNNENMSSINNTYEFYNVKNSFGLKRLNCIDSDFLFYNGLKRWWFLLRSISFSVNVILKLRNLSKTINVLNRDVVLIKLLSLAKKYGFIKQKVFYEAHIYSKKISKYCKEIDGLIVINNYLKELYEQDEIKNILLAHDGVKIGEYRNIKPNVKEEIANVVYIGNLFEWKGVYTLADSLKYLGKNIRLIIVGGSIDTLPSFKRYVIDNNIKNIEIVGFVKQHKTIEFIEKADVLILPNSARDKMSYYTSPIKLFEYMASKRPIVASRLPSIEEILEDEKNAVLFEPDNPVDLAKKIKWVINNNCDDIVSQAYNDVQEYTWDKRAEKIMGLINNEK